MTNSTKITTYLLSIFFLFGMQLLSAQCGTGEQVDGGVVTPYWRGEGQNDPGVPIPDMSSGQYALVNVIRGVQYEINAYHVQICHHHGGQHPASSSAWGVHTRFTAETSGQVRVYYTGGRSGLRIKIIGGVNNIDNQNSYNSDNKWRTHFYREMYNFTNYLGYKDYNSHSFREYRNRYDNTPIEVRSQGVARAGILRYFTARSLMHNTVFRGLYYVKLGADDGTRLFINDQMVYDRWNPEKDYTVKTQVIKFTGNDQLKYEYFNNNIPLEYIFEIDPVADKIIENTISGEQTLCAGESNEVPITGDDFNRTTQHDANRSFAFQWYYVTSLGGAPTDIDGATQKDFIPDTQTAPFNQAGTYYLYRRASVTFKNIGMSQQTESVTSNPVKIIVLNKPTAKAKPSRKSFCQGESDAKITVTANDGRGGRPPFTFHYQINGVMQPPIHSNNHIFEIPISTNQAGTFEYKYISITDGNNCTTKLHSIDPITINPLPTAAFLGQNTTLCLNTPATQIPWVTFTGELPFTVTIKGTKTGSPSVEFERTLEDNENRLPIEHNPNDEGEFTYELLWVSDKNGCKTFFTNQKLVVNVMKPSITLTTPEITWCLPEIVSAVYDESSGHTNVSENSYVLPIGDTRLDVVVNPVPCCPTPVLKWTINNDLNNVRTGQPSTHTGISFENDTSTDKTYNITYWLECNGQKYSYVTRQVRITPRPVLQFE
ncbi:MAG: hypothetical protein Q4A09_06595 [Capnocytophaga felis]|nr:hypothetical protein [Capnocytophaga felis]